MTADDRPTGTDHDPDGSSESEEPREESASTDHSGESGSTTQTAPDTAGGAPTTSTPPAHRSRS